jgi:hypothetical protein
MQNDLSTEYQYRGSLDETRTKPDRGSLDETRTKPVQSVYNKRSTLETTTTTLFLDSQPPEENSQQFLLSSSSERLNRKGSNSKNMTPVLSRKGSWHYKAKRESRMSKIFSDLFSSKKKTIEQKIPNSSQDIFTRSSLGSGKPSNESNMDEKLSNASNMEEVGNLEEKHKELKEQACAISKNAYDLLHFAAFTDRTNNSQLTLYEQIKFGFRWFDVSKEALIHTIVILYPILNKAHKQNVLQLASEVLLVMGIDQVTHDVLAELKNIAKQVSIEFPAAYRLLTVLSGKTLITSEETLNEAITNFNNPNLQLKSFDKWIEEGRVEEAGKELKKLERFYLKQIPVEDIFHFELSKSKEGSALRNALNYNNALMYVMISQVLSKDSVKKIVKTLEFFIDVINYLIKIHSYNTASMLAGGFDHLCMKELKQSINEKHKQILEEIQDLLSPKQNYKKLREILNVRPKKHTEKMKEDCLYPHHILSKDMTSSAEGNDFLKEDGSLNDNRLEVVAKIQKKFYEIWQQIDPDYQWETDFITQIKDMIKTMATEGERINDNFTKKAEALCRNTELNQ